MNEETRTAIDILTKPWTDVLSPQESGAGKYYPIDYPPMLDMLDEAKRSSLGGTSAGRSPDAERSLLNLKAFSLYEHIDGTTRAWWRETSKSRCPDDLRVALASLFGTLNALHASHQITDNRYGHITRQFPRWRVQIWELFDPPIVKELTGACPNCDETTYSNPEGERSPALLAFYWKGIRPEAKCQRCGEHWVGEGQLISLGRVLGATMDEDALREMGIAL